MSPHTDAEEMLPCPFCGGTNIQALEHLDWVACNDCGASLEDCEPSARELWNRRQAASQGSAGGERDEVRTAAPVCDLCEAELMCAACGHQQRPDVAQEAGNSGETAQPGTGPMRLDLMLEKVDAENAQNGEAFNDMRAHVWAAGASHEDADFITRMLTRKGLYLFQTEPWKRCPSTHCERRAECASARDCTVKTPSVPSAEGNSRG